MILDYQVTSEIKSKCMMKWEGLVQTLQLNEIKLLIKFELILKEIAKSHELTNRKQTFTAN